ncbi:hypothetical protein [Luteolibacter soli]|uniref:DUF3592 domain-containing protein n=1 Tax=Luteolibacter soli TaxID=3135280 RepID=A0ABU9AW89_9BACT
MMRPFYKARLFWCGVPGLVFLLWVWWDSGGYESRLKWNRGWGFREVRVERGMMGYMRLIDPTAGPGVKGELSADRLPFPEDDGTGGWKGRARKFDFFPTAFEKTVMEVEPSAGVIVDWVDSRLALWAAVAGYGVVWLGMVFAWQWRRRRVMRRLTDLAKGTEVAG